MRKFIRIVAAVMAFAALPVLAQAAKPDPELKAALMKSLDAVLPQWGAEVLRAPAGVDWTGNLNVVGVARGFGPSQLAELAASAPADSEGVKNDAGLVRVDRSRGYVRMVNNLLVPRIGDTAIRFPSDDQTRQLGLKILGELGIPAAEIGGSDVNTQMAADGNVSSLKPDRVRAILKLFSANRRVNKLPVFGSNALIAITGKGEVQRLKTQWPMFRMDARDALLTRADVLDRAGDALVDQEMAATSVLRAQIGYAPADNTVGSPYVPVALISAMDRKTPVFISVPLVKPSINDDR